MMGSATEIHASISKLNLEIKQQSKWNNRSILYKLQHRSNVLISFALGQLTLASLVHGLRYPQEVEFLPLRHGYKVKGIVKICPDSYK